VFYANPFFLPLNNSLCSSENSTLLPRCAASRLSKRLTALSIDSSTGVTLASWGNSTSSKFRGLEVLSLQDSLWSSTHRGTTRVTHATLRNSASMEFQGKEVLSLRDTLRCSTHMSSKVTSLQILRPTRNFLQTHLQEPEFFFLFTSDAFCKRPVSSYQDSYVNFYEEVYKQRWYQKRTTYCVSGGVT
jgi:hypothetical protein